MQALHEFGFESVGLTAADFEEEGKIVQLGFPPVRVDIITSITGVSWEQARSGRVKGRFGDLMVHYIGRDDFIANKRALGRLWDARRILPIWKLSGKTELVMKDVPNMWLDKDVRKKRPSTCQPMRSA